MQCVSLFSCAGFGDLGLAKAGIETISACEIVEERAQLFQKNFPKTHLFIGDIWELQYDIIQHAFERLNGKELFLMIISAPCQGASSNGMGRIKSQIKQGKREKDDPRNRLILPALHIINTLKPKFVIIENVPGMRYTKIVNENGDYETIFSIMYRTLDDYVIRSSILNTADFGVPQLRKRLVTIAIKKKYTSEERLENFFTENSFCHPLKTHGDDENPHITLQECFQSLSELDARYKLQDEYDIFHRIPKWNDMQYFCMSHTPEGESAFNNTLCVNCLQNSYDLNVIYCPTCNSILPRPYMKNKDGTIRIIRAFKTAYRRMTWHKPGNALTTNSGVVSSDVKAHPTQNRVLSLREIMILSSIGDYTRNDVLFTYDFPHHNDKLIREVLGECIPPLLTYKIIKHLQTLNNMDEMMNDVL